jgi:hypothetical protein
MTSEAVAAWVQAFGSIAALGVAVGLYWMDANARKAEATTRARNVALQMRERLREAQRSLSWSVERLDKDAANPHTIGVDEGGQSYGLWFLRRMEQRVREVLPLADGLGDAAPPVQRAFLLFQDLIYELEAYDDPSGDEATFYGGDSWPDTMALLRKTARAWERTVEATENI